MKRAGSGERVVLAPDVLGKSFFDPACRHILELWRDGAIRPVVTSALLQAYANLLEGLGIPHTLIRQWALWFTSPDRSHFLSADAAPGQGVSSLCTQAAVLGNTIGVIAASRKRVPANTEESPAERIRWIPASEYRPSTSA